MQLSLLHGWAMHSGLWDPLLPALPSAEVVKALDLPGHGYCADYPQDYTLESVAGIMQQQLPEQSVLVGWSLGGMVGMEIALQHPQQVQALILISSTPRFVNGDDWDKGVTAAVLEGFASELELGVERTVSRFLSLQLGNTRSTEQLRLLRQLVKSRPAPEAAVLRAGLAILANADMRSRLSQLTMPVLIIQGQRDRLTPTAATQWLLEHVVNAQSQIITGAGHAPFLSHSNEVATAINEFLQNINEEQE